MVRYACITCGLRFRGDATDDNDNERILLSVSRLFLISRTVEYMSVHLLSRFGLSPPLYRVWIRGPLAGFRPIPFFRCVPCVSVCLRQLEREKGAVEQRSSSLIASWRRSTLVKECGGVAGGRTGAPSCNVSSIVIFSPVVLLGSMYLVAGVGSMR